MQRWFYIININIDPTVTAFHSNNQQDVKICLCKEPDSNGLPPPSLPPSTVMSKKTWHMLTIDVTIYNFWRYTFARLTLMQYF